MITENDLAALDHELHEINETIKNGLPVTPDQILETLIVIRHLFAELKN